MNNTDKVIEILKEFGVFRNMIPEITDLAKLNSLTELANKINSTYQGEVSAEEMVINKDKLQEFFFDVMRYAQAHNLGNINMAISANHNQIWNSFQDYYEGSEFVKTLKLFSPTASIESEQGKEYHKIMEPLLIIPSETPKSKKAESEQGKEDNDHICPFCKEKGFDLIGLKHHVNTYCELYTELENIYFHSPDQSKSNK